MKMINRKIQNSKKKACHRKNRKHIMFLTDTEKAYINIQNSECKAIIISKVGNESNYSNGFNYF